MVGSKRTVLLMPHQTIGLTLALIDKFALAEPSSY